MAKSLEHPFQVNQDSCHPLPASELRQQLSQLAATIKHSCLHCVDRAIQAVGYFLAGLAPAIAAFQWGALLFRQERERRIEPFTDLGMQPGIVRFLPGRAAG
jgi:hypothetical protein